MIFPPFSKAATANIEKPLPGVVEFRRRAQRAGFFIEVSLTKIKDHEIVIQFDFIKKNSRLAALGPQKMKNFGCKGCLPLQH
jgi:hypothetical protein